MKPNERLTSARSNKKSHVLKQNQEQFGNSQTHNSQSQQKFAFSQQQQYNHENPARPYQQQLNSPQNQYINQKHVPLTESQTTNRNTLKLSRKPTVIVKRDVTKRPPRKRDQQTCAKEFEQHSQNKIEGLKMMYWNVDGGMNIISSKHEQILHAIDQFKPTILCVQEAIGTKGKGYIRRSKSSCGNVSKMKLITMDDYGVTAIYLHHKVRDYVTLHFPSSLFEQFEPKDKIHATGVVVSIKRQVRNRNSIIFINVYRSPGNSAAPIAQVSKLINWTKQFVEDQSPNIILGGDMNFWSELNGSDPKKRTKYKKKFEDGDSLTDALRQQKMSIFSNKQPTMWKQQSDGTIIEYSVDSLWMTNNLKRHVDVTSNFASNIKISDHYPHRVSINQIKTFQAPKGCKTEWKINEATTDDWNRFEDTVNQQCIELHEQIKLRVKQPATRIKTMMDASIKTIQHILINSAIQCIGKKIITRKHKVYINSDIKMIINELRKEKKRIKCVLNRERKLKQKHGHLMNDMILKRDIGINAFHRLKTFKERQRYKEKMIRQARRKWINSKIDKLTKKKDKKWHETLNEIENIAYGKHKHIGHIIRPSIAVHPPQQNKQHQQNTASQIESPATNRITCHKANQRTITMKNYTKNDLETAEEINKYFNTIGTASNPNYHNTMKNQSIARRLDEPFDFNPAAHPTYQDELNKLTAPFKSNELRYHAHKLKNNKKFGIDDIHTLFVKHGITGICHVLLLVFNYWKDTGQVTHGLNERLIIPLLKPGKSHEVVKGLRPISIENIIWKLYQMMVESRIARYVTNLGIISQNQFASKKGSSAEDCLIDIVMSIDEAIKNHQPVHAAGFDSSDAYDSMMELILDDKLKYHAGMNDKGVIMVKSLSIDRTSRCLINGTKSSLMKTQSGPFQGAPPSGLLWIIYINPLILRIDKFSKNKFVKIGIKSFMDDITIFTMFLKTYLKNQIPLSVQFQAGKLFQQSIDFIVYYLKVNNIPINAGKTQIMTIVGKNHHQKGSDSSKDCDSVNGQWPLNETDHLMPFKEQQFSVDGKECEKRKEIIILGLSMVQNWSFSNQINKIVTRMKQVRGRCWSLLKSNKNSINMEAIKEIMVSTSFQLLNYAGNIFLHKGEELNPIRMEYNKSIRMLSSKCRTVSVAAMLNFHGLKSFEYHVQLIGAKALSKFIRCPDNNALKIKKQSFIKDHKNWVSKLNRNGKWIEVDNHNVSKYFPRDKKDDMIWNWYSAARTLGSTDCMFLESDNFLKRIEQKFIPEPLPEFIQFHDFTNPWNDESMSNSGIYYFLDGSVYYESANRKLHNHGIGGGAMTIYKEKRLIKRIICPISTRTHINTMEMAMFYQSFLSIFKEMHSTGANSTCCIPQTIVSVHGDVDTENKEIRALIEDDSIYTEFKLPDSVKRHVTNRICECMDIEQSIESKEEIHIISDSQNCIKLLKQEIYTEDEALIQIMQAINDIFEQNQITNKRIIIHWVESHDESKLNDEVDFLAKIAAQRMIFQQANFQTNSQHGNQYIAYQTLKQELKSKATQNEVDNWVAYKEARKDKWSNHYYKWNIPHDKRFGKELLHLSKLENELRIMLYTNHFPVNSFWHDKLHMAHVSPLCNNSKCMQAHINESLFHFLVECPQYEQNRKIMVESVQNLYNKHNMLNKQDHKVYFIRNKHDQRYLQQFIFPSKQISMDIRVRILKSLIKFIISTDRIRNMYW